jgi:hypothetical protein
MLPWQSAPLRRDTPGWLDRKALVIAVGFRCASAPRSKPGTSASRTRQDVSQLVSQPDTEATPWLPPPWLRRPAATGPNSATSPTSPSARVNDFRSWNCPHSRALLNSRIRVVRSDKAVTGRVLVTSRDRQRV